MGDKNHGWLEIDENQDVILVHDLVFENKPVIDGKIRITNLDGSVPILNEISFGDAIQQGIVEIEGPDTSKSDPFYHVKVKATLIFGTFSGIVLHLKIDSAEFEDPLITVITQNEATAQSNMAEMTSADGHAILKWNTSKNADGYVAITKGYGLPPVDENGNHLVRFPGDSDLKPFKPSHLSLNDYSYFIAFVTETGDRPSLINAFLTLDYSSITFLPRHKNTRICYCTPQGTTWIVVEDSVHHDKEPWIVDYNASSLELGSYTVLEPVSPYSTFAA